MDADPSTEERAFAPLSGAEERRAREMLLRPLPETSPSLFYDDVGSALFEEITRLPEYYQTRTEIGLLEQFAHELIARAQPLRLVELGSGAGRKIRLLLDAWHPPAGASATMMDVNQLFLRTSIERLSLDYPTISFGAVDGDFTRDLSRLGPGGRRLIVFFGGTIGNLYPHEQRTFFADLRRQMDETDAMLIGVDLVKDPARLEAAYNDSAGVTARFNRRSLYSFNRRLGADFQPEAFHHRAFYDVEAAWIEMRLVASRPMEVRIPGLDLVLRFSEGDELRTEVSCKFTRASLEAVAPAFRVDLWKTDPEELFGLALLRAI